MERYASKPGMARNTLSMLRVLIALAIEDGILANDPTIGIKRPKLSKDGWHAWSEDQAAQYEAKHLVGSQARLAFALAIHTSQRAADLIRMGRQHVRDGRISVRQQKTGTALWIPIHPGLKTIMDATPSNQLTFLVTSFGKPYATANAFGHRMRLWAREAGLSGCSPHGLRKVCLRRLAEAGCTAPEIMAISGQNRWQRSSAISGRRSRSEMGDRAIARTETYPRADQSYPREEKG